MAEIKKLSLLMQDQRGQIIGRHLKVEVSLAQWYRVATSIVVWLHFLHKVPPTRMTPSRVEIKLYSGMRTIRSTVIHRADLTIPHLKARIRDRISEMSSTETTIWTVPGPSLQFQFWLRRNQAYTCARRHHLKSWYKKHIPDQTTAAQAQRENPIHLP